MNTHMRRAAVAVAATAMAVSLAACGSAKGAGDSKASSESGKKKGDNITVGLLLPENQTARYEKFDRPLIEKRVSELTHGKGKVQYLNAKEDASTQAQQVETMITNKVDVLIVDAVDSASIQNSLQKAHDAHIPIVAYDRLAQGPIDSYVSFDNYQVGVTQGKALLEKLGPDASKKQIVMMNGDIANPNSGVFKKGALSVLKGKVKIGKSYNVKGWKPEIANSSMAAAITALGKDKIDGVLSANDGMATGIITAIKAANISPVPPVTGQDADLAAVQRIVSGEQFMSVYKPYVLQSPIAAEMAVKLAQGRDIGTLTTSTVDSPTNKNIPAVILPVVSLTRTNIKDTVLKDGVYQLSDICTAPYKAGCDSIGLK